MPQADGWLWTISQRRALIAMALSLCLLLTFNTFLWPVYVGPTLPPHGSNTDELSDRLNPNTATAAELATLMRLGVPRSKAIVAYRENFLATHPGQIAFHKPEDLMNIKGIGRATVEKLKPYLSFDSPATDP